MNGKFLLLKVIGLAFVVLSVVNCAKKSDGGSSTPAATCAAGQTATVAGCLTSCGTGLVYYGNQCVSVAQVVPGTGTSASCGTGKLNSQYGCLPQCGTNAVWYGNSCVQVTGGTGTTTPPYGQGDICSGRCGAGAVETYSGCMPQYSCGPCYGYNNGYCYKGVHAEQYYYGY